MVRTRSILATVVLTATLLSPTCIASTSAIHNRRRPAARGAATKLPSSLASNRAKRPLPSSTVSAASDLKPSISPLLVLQSSSFFMVLASALVAFSPAPALVAKLGTERATKTLSMLSASAALTEIILSPALGSMLDSVGRKPLLLCAAGAVATVHGMVSLYPSVASISAAKFVGMFAAGLFFMSCQAITSDVCMNQPERMSAAIGRQFALTGAGFLVGALIAGRIADLGVSVSYGASTAVVTSAALLVAFGMRETLLPSQRVPFQKHSTRKLLLQAPWSCTRLLRHGPQIRLLAILLMLQSLPMFMGDFFQIFARQEWNLSTSQFSSFVAMYGVIGIVANTVGSVLVKNMGIKRFTAMATLSAMCGPLGASLGNFQGLVAGALLGFLGGAQTLGITAALYAQGHEAGVPQGELAGERASIMALLKVIGPIWYSVLYVQGQKWWGLKSLPFLFNVGLALAAFSISQLHLPQ